jgi:hypothetical protein
MKKSLIAMAVLVASTGAFAHGAAAVAAGSNSLVSKSVSGVVATGTGSATSSAFNAGFAASGVTVGGSAGGTSTASQVQNSGHPIWGTATRTSTVTKQGDVSVSGYTETANMSGVVTTQSGSALAAGAAGGIAAAHAGGVGAFHTVNNGPEGSVAGSSTAFTASGVASVGNGSNMQNAGMYSSFGAIASADISTTTVQKGKTILGHFIPTSQPSQSDVKNAATSTVATAGSTGGFTVVTPIANSGSAVGGVINNATGSAIANSSVSGLVSATVAN